eukprot:CAMPEP_0196570538 /NCGR_PEP_ID=MMETSP1081-20130531/647_1 /TAXON_ID=36882 /ORGANISM="Pyramimonas amylifera, Strain CCMP720" /LENGTH=122 /DNA_ID=CAMNT_0041887039 /DNA_START=125 /DNA_END=493 /DNA_ORIENTATION=-
MAFVASSIVIAPVSKTVQFQSKKVQSSSRSVAVVCASKDTSRRSVLSLAAASLALIASRSEAITIPSQDSTAGVTSPKKASASGASMSGYTLEGTNKGALSPKNRKELLAKVRADAVIASKK